MVEAQVKNNTYVENGRLYDLNDVDLGPATLTQRLRELWLRWHRRGLYRRLHERLTR